MVFNMVAGVCEQLPRIRVRMPRHVGRHRRRERAAHMNCRPTSVRPAINANAHQMARRLNLSHQCRGGLMLLLRRPRVGRPLLVPIRAR